MGKNSGYDSDCSSYNSSNTGARKRRTPVSFQLRINGNGARGFSDEESSVTQVSDSISIAESKDEDEDYYNADLPSPTATAEAATKTDDVNEMLSQELLKMSLLDRTDIQEEIHGVRCLCVDESPELLRESLQEFKKNLDALPDFKKKTYLQIVSVAEEERRLQEQQKIPRTKHYAVDDEDFRLRFLRAELFDSKRAVLRFVNYFEFVHEFWGFEIVSKRQVRLSDFSKEELKFLKKGYFQLLPFRDRSGRRVVVILGENKSDANNNGTNGKKNQVSYKTNPTTKAKCYFYLWDVASRDSIESQQKGVVAIAHPHGICFDLQNHELYLVHRLSVSVPTRMVASHNFCLDFSGYKLLAKVVVAHVISGGKHKQIIRQKFQVGLNDTEMRYYLQGFGIPVQFFPLTETGTIKMNYFNKWIKTRSYLEAREEEEAERNKKNANEKTKGFKKKKKDKSIVVVECPLLNDVVFRQGKPYKENPGNDVLRDSILEEMNRKMLASLESNSYYGNTNRMNGHSNNHGNGNHHGRDTNGALDSSTEQFCNWLIEEIENNRKGRFLTWDGSLNSWVLMSDTFKIRRKISVSLYNYEKRHSAALGKKMPTKATIEKGGEVVEPSLTTSASTLSLKRNESHPKLHSSSAPSLQFISAFGLGLGAVPSSSLGKTEEDDLAYRFIEGGRQSAADFLCNMPMAGCGNNGISGQRKRSRESFFSPK